MISAPHNIYSLRNRFRSAEMGIFTIINNKIHCNFLNFFMLLLSFTGSALFAIFLLLFFLLSRSIAGVNVFPHLLGALVMGQLLVHPIKWLVNRPRPCLAHSKTKAFRALKNCNSFPSGHTCAAITIALVLAQCFPGLSILLFTAAGLVGMSRIYLGVHYPSDVLAGGAIGYFSFYSAPYICTSVLAYIPLYPPV